MLKKNYEFRTVLSRGKFFSGNYINAFVMDNRKNFNLLGHNPCHNGGLLLTKIKILWKRYNYK